MASQKQLESARITRKGHSNTQVTAPPSTMMVGRSLKRVHCQRVLVTTRKQAAHKLSGAKGSLSSLKRVPRPLFKQESTCRNQQHYSGVIHKQGSRHEVGPTLCPTVENLEVLFQKASNSQSQTHSRLAECGRRKAIQARPDHPNRVISPSRGLPSDMQQVALASNRPICHEVQQVASFCITRTRSPNNSSGRPQSAMGGSGCLCLPTSSHIRQGGGEAAGLPMQENNSDCSGMAEHALVLGFSGHVQPNNLSLPSLPNLLTQPCNQIPHRNLSNLNLHAWLVEPQQSKSRAYLRQWQKELKLLRQSTRSVYVAKWAIFTKWCISHQVDFRAPPIKSVTDFLMYLFQDKKLQLSTIDGYRSAIADKLGSSHINVSKDENLTCLWDSFYRDRPQGQRGIPSSLTGPSVQSEPCATTWTGPQTFGRIRS